MTFKVFGYDSKIHKCIHCDNAKRLLDVKKTPYEFVSIMPASGRFDEEVMTELLTRLGRESRVGLTMPQVFDSKGSHIGGFTELREYFK